MYASSIVEFIAIVSYKLDLSLSVVVKFSIKIWIFKIKLLLLYYIDNFNETLLLTLLDMPIVEVYCAKNEITVKA